MRSHLLPLVIVLLLMLSIGVLPLAPTTTHAQSEPPGVVYSIPITLTNNQAVPTPKPFQQMVVVNSAAYASYEAPNLQNIEFFDSNGAVVPSWLESGNSNMATDTVYWLKLVNGIPADSALTLYMGFASLSSNLFNGVTTGEAPELSPSYGQYDNGVNVFAYYWNFPGPNLPLGWVFSQAASIGGYSVDNGASFYTGSGETNAIYGYYDTPLTAGSYLISTDMQSYAGGNNGEGVWFGWWSNPQSPLVNGSYNGNYVSDWIWCPFFNCVQPLRIVSNGGTTPAALPNGGYPPGSALYDATQYMTYRLSWQGSNQTAILYPPSGGTAYASQMASSPSQGSYYLGFWDTTGGEGNNGETAQWVSASAMPPNGVMPSVEVGGQPQTSTVTISTSSGGITSSVVTMSTTSTSNSTSGQAATTSPSLLLYGGIAAAVIIVMLAILLVTRRRGRKLPQSQPTPTARSTPAQQLRPITPEVAQKLQQLKSMLDAGLITQEDYEAQKKRLLE
jgi:hypothetical protein